MTHTREKDREYYEKNHDRILARQRAYRQAHAEEKREQTRKYHREYYANNKDKLREYHNEYYRSNKNKQELVNYKGAKCALCGYDKCIAALDFHHLDPSKKDMDFKWTANKRKLEKIKIELDKCILLCANCHREVHYKPELLNKLATAWETITSA